MEISDYIAIISIAVTTVISIIGGVYVVASNTKKFELEESYKREILDWYSKTVSIMTTIISKVDMDKIEYQNEMATLSAQIEIGRFYFPNLIVKGDDFGKNKPKAYQGYRHIVLDFLVFFYDTSKRKDAEKHKKALWEFLRLYTSSIFQIIEPRNRNKKIKKYSGFKINNSNLLNDILQNEECLETFFMDSY